MKKRFDLKQRCDCSYVGQRDVDFYLFGEHRLRSALQVPVWKSSERKG